MEMELSLHEDLKKFVFSKGTQKYWAYGMLLKAEKETADVKLNNKRQLDLYGFLPSSTGLN